MPYFFPWLLQCEHIAFHIRTSYFRFHSLRREKRVWSIHRSVLYYTFFTWGDQLCVRVCFSNIKCQERTCPHTKTTWIPNVYDLRNNFVSSESISNHQYSGANRGLPVMLYQDHLPTAQSSRNSSHLDQSQVACYWLLSMQYVFDEHSLCDGTFSMWQSHTWQLRNGRRERRQRGGHHFASLYCTTF